MLTLGNDYLIVKNPNIYLDYFMNSKLGISIIMLYISIYHSFVVKDMLRSEKSQELYMKIMSFVLALHSCYYVLIAMKKEDLFFNIFQAVLVFFVLLISIGFLSLLATLASLSSSSTELRQMSLRKYKQMFDAIQESIMVVSESKVTYLNKQAVKLYQSIT
jgi:hypothetical protein